MPVVFTNPQFPYQVGASPFNQSFSTQLNYREMIGEVTNWNPSVDPEVAGRWLNNYYRKIINMRSWYGLKVRGIINVPNINSTGTAIVVRNNTLVTGIGTNWTPDIVGLQFRQAFTYPYQTITYVDPSAQTLLLATPYAGPDATGPFQIVQAYVTLGANVKRIMWASNQQQGWPINVRTNIESLNAWDVWRVSLGWVRHFAKRPPTPDGQLQVEIWPTPYAAQTFPFEAYTQPPNMVKDEDTPVAWIPSDLIVTRAIADAMMKGGRKSDYYDPTNAAMKIAEFKEACEAAQMTDNDLDQTDVMWDYEFGSNDVQGDGSAYGQAHDV
jgi:hypothetical protein